MRQTYTQPIDAFFAVLSTEFGSNVHRKMKVTEEQFVESQIKMEAIGIDRPSAEQIAYQIARLREDGKIDAISFMDFMSEEERDPLNILKDIIYLNGQKFEDIMNIMGIKKENAKLDYIIIRDGQHLYLYIWAIYFIYRNIFYILYITFYRGVSSL